MRLLSSLSVALLALFAAQQSHMMAQNVTTEAEDTRKNDTCPMGASLDMEDNKLLATLFPGLFVDRRQLRTRAMRKILATMVKSQRRRILKKNAYTTEAEANEECCEMITEIIKPIRVQHDDVFYDVVHLNSDEQLVTTTSCVSHHEPCNSSGRCLHKTGYNWILVWDPSLQYYPPVKFVPIEINVGCACQ